MKIYGRSPIRSPKINKPSFESGKVVCVVAAFDSPQMWPGKRQKPSPGHRPATRGKRSEQQKRRRRRRAASAAENGPEKPPKERNRGRHVFWRPRETTERPAGRKAAEPPWGEGQRAALLRSQRIKRILMIVLRAVVFGRVGGWVIND